MRRALPLAVVLSVVASASVAAQSPIVQLPKGLAEVYSWVGSGSSEFATGPSFLSPACGGTINYQEGTVSASAVRDCTISGVVEGHTYESFDAGSIHTGGAASMIQGGALKASIHMQGTLNAGVHAFTDAAAQYNDALRITGSSVPSSVLFTLFIHGTTTGTLDGAPYGGAGGYYPDGNLSNPQPLMGRLDFTRWNIESDGSIHGGNGVGAVEHNGDGSIRTEGFSVPWEQFVGGVFAYQLSLVTFGRTGTPDHAYDIDIDSDFSNTAGLQAVQVFDAGGNDITSQMHLSFASAPTSTVTPEPVSMALLGTGLFGVGVVRRRKRQAVV